MSTFDDYWHVVSAIDALAPEYDAEAARARDVRRTDEANAASLMQARLADARRIEELVNQSLAAARESLAGVGEENRLPAKVRAAAPPDTDPALLRQELDTAVRALSDLTNRTTEHREASRRRRLEEAKRREDAIAEAERQRRAAELAAYRDGLRKRAKNTALAIGIGLALLSLVVGLSQGVPIVAVLGVITATILAFVVWVSGNSKAATATPPSHST